MTVPTGTVPQIIKKSSRRPELPMQTGRRELWDARGCIFKAEVSRIHSALPILP